MRIALLLFGFALIGCGSPEPSPVDSVPNLHEVKLTMEIWEASQEEEKFAPETIERLRKEDRRLKKPAVWREFRDTKLRPAFQSAVGISYNGKM